MGAGVVDGVQLAVGVEHGDRWRGSDADGFALGEVFKAADGNHGPPLGPDISSATSQVQVVGNLPGSGRFGNMMFRMAHAEARCATESARESRHVKGFPQMRPEQGRQVVRVDL